MQIVEHFDKMYRDKEQLSLLSWTYWVLTSIGLILSGIAAIFNQSLGAALLVIPIICLVAVCLNMFTWGIIASVAQKKRNSRLYRLLVRIEYLINKQEKKSAKTAKVTKKTKKAKKSTKTTKAKKSNAKRHAKSSR